MFWELLKKQSDQERRVELIRVFLLQKDHEWILRSPKVKSRLIEFFSLLTTKDLISLFQRKKLLLLRTDGRFSCTLKKDGRHEIILVYPDLLRLFESAEFPIAQAILAHEVGHILLQHNAKNINLLDAQIEADRFAAQLGYAEELSMALRSFPYTKEIQKRVSLLDNG